VVHGKGSLLGRMPGDPWRKFANLRAYLGFMWGHPGKKLLFMGGEIAQPSEWNHDAAVPWALLDDARHRGVQALVRDLNALLRAEPALHARDAAPEGFRWVIGDDRAQSVFAFLRLGTEGQRPALVVCNLTPVPRHGYRIGVPRGRGWREALNTDGAAYGGTDTGSGGYIHAEPHPSHGFDHSLLLILPPLATLILLPEG
jgi:1,4-alpha-glucan branching enzyme